MAITTWAMTICVNDATTTTTSTTTTICIDDSGTTTLINTISIGHLHHPSTCVDTHWLENLTSPYGARTTSFLVSETPTNDEVLDAHGDLVDEHGFYGQNVAMLSRSRSSSTLSPTE